jgi:hypothetical protein
VSLSAACSSSNGSGSSETPADFCSQLQGYVTKCNVTDPCTVQTSSNCTQLASALSSQTLAAYAQCYTDSSCGDAGAALAASCFATATKNLTPSAAQEKLATDYCAVCTVAPETAAECAAGFYSTGGDGGTPGVGSSILDLSDSLATQLDTQCVAKIAAGSSALVCLSSLGICAEPIIAAAVTLPAACTTAVVVDGG